VAAAHVGADHQAQLAQKIQRPINGGAVNGAGRALDARENFIEGRMPAGLADGVEDELALRRHAEAALAHQFGIIPAGV
jgi:hypothetical protein